MNATNTTLCMLLAAALGSAATATTLWRIRPMDPLTSYLEETKDAFIRKKTQYGRYIAKYSIPEKPLQLVIEDICPQKKEEVWDAYTQAIGADTFKYERIDGIQVAYTTTATMDRYHAAISHLATRSLSPSTERAKKVINETMRPEYGSPPLYLNDGTPLINWKRASAVLGEVTTLNHFTERMMRGVPPGLSVHDEVYLPEAARVSQGTVAK